MRKIIIAALAAMALTACNSGESITNVTEVTEVKEITKVVELSRLIATVDTFIVNSGMAATSMTITDTTGTKCVRITDLDADTAMIVSPENFFWNDSTISFISYYSMASGMKKVDFLPDYGDTSYIAIGLLGGAEVPYMLAYEDGLPVLVEL